MLSSDPNAESPEMYFCNILISNMVVLFFVLSNMLICLSFLHPRIPLQCGKPSVLAGFGPGSFRVMSVVLLTNKLFLELPSVLEGNSGLPRHTLHQNLSSRYCCQSMEIENIFETN